ncbi:DUF4394 domain-containing protein [Hymenobacter rubripertinctus]|nr:DUF4394 domain-containing protein [Hymenobacter rubripertinctus]
MNTALPFHLTAGFWRRTCGVLATGALLLGVVGTAQAQTIFGLSGTELTSLNATSLSTAPTRQLIVGVTAGQVLVGLDFRPATGELFALGYDATTTGDNARLYVLSQNISSPTATATPVGSAAVRLELGGPGERIVFDFNPTVDRLRVEGTNDNNYRLNPNNGALAFTDGRLKFATTDTNAGQDPFVGAGAYTNSYIGTTSTTLYTIDEQRSLLLRQDPPNDGTLNTVGTLSVPTNGPGVSTDLDIVTTGPNANQAFLIINTPVGATFSATLYQVNLLTGALVPVGNQMGAGVGITDIAISIDRTAPAASGQLLYAVSTTNNLLSFYSGTPNYINSATPITGIAAGQTLVGTDFRPATGQLIGLGYNPATTATQVYSIDRSSAVATAVGPAIALNLGGSTDNIGFDFNPTVDRLRVVSTTGADFRLNPNDGALAATDGTLAYAATDINAGATPRVGSAAYTNSFAGTTTTTLYDIDEALSNLVIQNPPNAGVLNTVGSTGLNLSTSNALVDLDIFFDQTASTNTAYLAANPNGQNFNNLYTLNLGSGAPTLVGAIGLGITVRDVAAFIAAPNGTITWTGAVSTAWALAGNWSPMQIPTSSDDVLIPDTANDPVVSDPRQVNSLTLGSGATLTTANMSLLTLNGNFVNSGGTVLGAGNGEVRFAGPALQTISGTATQFQNLTAGPAGVTLNAPASVQRVLTLNIGTLTTNGNLTLLSNASGSAEVVNSGTGTTSGTTTVQRYIDPSRNGGVGYRHYAAPVSGSTVADLATTNFTPTVNPAYNTAANPGAVLPFPTVFGYDESRVNTSGNPAPQDFDKGFFSPSSTADPLVVTRGYTVNLPASETVDFVGALNNGSYATGSLSRGSQTESGFHLRGNPYPSAIDWNFVVRDNVDATVYVYRSTGQYAGTYSTYTVNGTGTNGGTREIATSQGFFVRASTSGASLTFNNAARITAYTNPVFQRSAATAPLVRLDLRNAAGAADEAVLYFDDAATAGFDPALDAYKLLGGSPLALASTNGSGPLLAVNALPALTAAGVTVPLRLQAAAGTYTLRATELLRLPAGTYAYLQDALTGTTTDLSQPTGYAFAVTNAASLTGRFSVLITAQRVLANAPAALVRQVNVYPNPARGQVSIVLPAQLRQQPVQVSLINTIGQQVLRRTLNVSNSVAATELSLSGVAPGVYTVRLQTAGGTVSKRLMVE